MKEFLEPMVCTKIGIMGGTYNPIHLAHLRVAEEAAEYLQIHKVLFIPAYQPPHKDPSLLAPFVHRLNMVQLSTRDHPAFVSSDIEGRLGGTSYTVRTLRHLMQLESVKNADWFYFVGSDAFFDIETWWNFREIFSLCNTAVLTRHGFSLSKLKEFVSSKIDSEYCWNSDLKCFEHARLKKIFVITVTHLDISASKIRKLLREGKSIRFLVPEKVRNYIARYGLYRQEKDYGK